MSRADLILAGVLAVLFSAVGCGEETPGGGAGSGGTGGSGGSAGAGGTGGTTGSGGVGVPAVCASFWEQPAASPLVSTECTYDLDATPAIRDCATFDSDGAPSSRLIREYADETVPCGYPCVTGNMPSGQNTGDHFDAALRSIVEAAFFAPDGVTLMSRSVYTLDQHGHLQTTDVYDGDGNLDGTGITTYDPPGVARPDTFETRLDNDLVTDGAFTWNPNGRLDAFEVTVHLFFLPRSRFDYTYNPDGSLMEVTRFNVDEVPDLLLSTFEFAYPFPQATVTYVLADSTIQSVLTYDFVCAP